VDFGISSADMSTDSPASAYLEQGRVHGEQQQQHTPPLVYEE